MILDLLLISQLSRFNLTSEQVTKQVETIKQETQVSAKVDADPHLRKLADAGAYLELTQNGIVRIVKGESTAEKREREERERQEAIERQRLVESARKRSFGGNSNVVGKFYGWCTDYVKSQGKYLPSGYGTAGRLPAIKREPQVGDAVVTYEGAVGHVALVIGVNGDEIKIREANYDYPYITERTLNWQSGIIKGFL
jgi:hypothetical protein